MDVMKCDLVCSMMKTYISLRCTKLNCFTGPFPTIVLFPYLYIVNREISNIQNIVNATAVRSAAITTIFGIKPTENFGIVPLDEIFKIFILLIELGDDSFFICQEEFDVGDLGFLTCRLEFFINRMEKNRLWKIVNTCYYTANSRNILGHTRTAMKAIAPGETLFTPQRFQWCWLMVVWMQSDEGPNNIDRSI